jgi:MoaA/NifB/PqqE/SkfB family radical SAM enzyme
MIGRAKTILDLLRLVRHGGPAVCNVSVTNTCNAVCGFCNFAYDKGYVRDRRWLDADRFAAALAILRQHGGVRYVIFMGGEPLLHTKLVDMVSTARSLGI